MKNDTLLGMYATAYSWKRETLRKSKAKHKIISRVFVKVLDDAIFDEHFQDHVVETLLLRLHRIQERVEQIT